MRVQIPAYTDRWMMGDRFGEILKISMSRPGVATERGIKEPVEIAHVRLDKSGKTVRVILNDCEVL
jgi:hypothetical protein